MTTTAIAKQSEMLRDIQSFDDAVKLLENHGYALRDSADVIGDGFSVVDKAELVGVPFVVLAHKFVNGDFGEMVVMHVVTREGRKALIVDGSTGIYDQVKLTPEELVPGLIFAKGLTRSDYTFTDEKGKEKPATTFYLA